MARIKRRRLRPPSPEVSGLGARYPFVALLGRPNVGKSTLFNRLVGQRLAITEPTAGTTRDRIAALITLPNGKRIELCDMGGVGGTGDPHDKDVNRQIDLAMKYADLVLLVCDARAGLTPLDEDIARRVMKLAKQVLVIANKVETQALEYAANEFYAFGFPCEVVPVSAREGTGRTDLLEALQEALPAEAWQAEGAPETPPELARLEHGRAGGERLLRLAIVGRRNVGKSTLVNALAGERRVIDSEKAGTTRDAVDVLVQVGGKPVVLIDTAGLRKRGRADDHIEIISHGRAVDAIRRSDVVLLLLDCLQDISQVDKKIARTVQDEHKSCAIVANKWDLVEDRMSLEQYADYVQKALPGLAYAPIVGISALEGHHDTAPVEVAHELFRQSRETLRTGPLNRLIAAAMTRRRPKAKGGRIGKVFFCTQVATNPVTLLLFVNEPELFDDSWRRYLANQLRQNTPWEEIPIKLAFRSRDSLKGKGGLKSRVKQLEGLAASPRWIDQDVEQGALSYAEDLDAEDVKFALRDAFVSDDDPGDGLTPPVPVAEAGAYADDDPDDYPDDDPDDDPDPDDGPDEDPGA